MYSRKLISPNLQNLEKQFVSLRCASTKATMKDLKPFLTLDEAHTSELEVKRSRFVATAWPVDTPEEALERIRSSSDPSASHNCFAFKVGQQYRFSDDGEPGGTAGKPIFGAIEGEKVDHVAVLVVRYYGGVQLGTGGLVRAYGQAARDCLRAARRVERRPRLTAQVELPFSMMGPVYGALERLGAVRQGEEYREEGTIRLTLTIEPGAPFETARQQLRDLSAGQLQLELVEEEPGDD